MVNDDRVGANRRNIAAVNIIPRMIDHQFHRNAHTKAQIGNIFIPVELCLHDADLVRRVGPDILIKIRDPLSFCQTDKSGFLQIPHDTDTGIGLVDIVQVLLIFFLCPDQQDSSGILSDPVMPQPVKQLCPRNQNQITYRQKNKEKLLIKQTVFRNILQKNQRNSCQRKRQRITFEDTVGIIKGSPVVHPHRLIC